MEDKETKEQKKRIEIASELFRNLSDETKEQFIELIKVMLEK